LRKCTKSDFVSILELAGETRETPPADLTAKVFDGAAIVQMIRSSAAKMYGDYNKNIFWPFILNSEGTITRIDVVFDAYIEESLEAETRKEEAKA
jgi:hypothetical protein